MIIFQIFSSFDKAQTKLSTDWTVVSKVMLVIALCERKESERCRWAIFHKVRL